MDTDLVVCGECEASVPGVAGRDVEELRAALRRENLECRRAQAMANIQTNVVKFAVDLLVREPDIEGFFRALMKTLAEEGESHKVSVWLVDEARTPREYLGLLRTTDGRRAAMTALTRRFEQIWYGNQPAAPADVSDVRTYLEELGCLRPGEQAI